MRVLIAHPSASEGQTLAQQLSSLYGFQPVHPVCDLTATYDFAEHRRPDFVVISFELADCPEFEILCALFDRMQIGYVVFADQANQKSKYLNKTSAENLVIGSTTTVTEALSNALRKLQIKAPQRVRSTAKIMECQFDPKRFVLIGSSTGGVDALIKVLGEFPTDCPPTLIVQHTGASFAKSLIRLLDGATAAKVRPAQSGELLKSGNIYLAQDDRSHLEVSANMPLRLMTTPSPPVAGHRPSVDALFKSALPHAKFATAAILTGMGSDGADGINALRQNGARTIGQDEATCVVYGMPRVAMERGAIESQLPIHKIGPALLRASQSRILL